MCEVNGRNGGKKTKGESLVVSMDGENDGLGAI